VSRSVIGGHGTAARHRRTTHGRHSGHRARALRIGRSIDDLDCERHRRLNSDLSDRIYRRSLIGMAARSWFGFPNPVNETSARLVAAGVVVQSLLFLALREWWVLVPLAAGFLARVLAGPRFSPLGRLVTEVITPRLEGEHRFVPGPPKRFAQGVGLVFSAGALIAELAGAGTVAVVLVAGLAVAAGLEAVFAVCLGCIVFGRLMAWGVIPADVCESCNDISGRLAARSRELSSTNA
jgi:hypothetical protein